MEDQGESSLRSAIRTTRVALCAQYQAVKSEAARFRQELMSVKESVGAQANEVATMTKSLREYHPEALTAGIALSVVLVSYPFGKFMALRNGLVAGAAASAILLPVHSLSALCWAQTQVRPKIVASVDTLKKAVDDAIKDLA